MSDQEATMAMCGERVVADSNGMEFSAQNHRRALRAHRRKEMDMLAESNSMSYTTLNRT